MTNQQGAPEALRSIARYKIGYHTDEWGMRDSTPSGIPDRTGAWVLYKDHVAALVKAQQRATHVQNPAVIEHVAGDVSKTGAESNMAQQPSPTPQADSQPAPVRDYPPLPEQVAWRDSVEHCDLYWRPAVQAQNDLEPLFTKQQMRAYVDADRAASAPADSVLEDAARWFSERDNVLHSFWVLLGEAETQADNDNNPLLKHQVEGFYRQWNALNGSALVPRWVTRAARKQGGAT